MNEINSSRVTKSRKEQQSITREQATGNGVSWTNAHFPHLALHDKIGNRAVAHLLQAKAHSVQPDNSLERQAEAVADQVVAKPLGAQVPSGRDKITPYNVSPAGRSSLHVSAVDEGIISTIVRHGVSSPGRPLAPLVQSELESRFGQGLGQVRVHTDRRAAESAQALNAHAYTVGHDIIFGRGHYAPQQHTGRHLLAHELTHVLQQRVQPAMSVNPQMVIQRRGPSIGGFFSNLARGFLDIFGQEPSFDRDALLAYLKTIHKGATENDFDSDDKARAVVSLWQKGDPQFTLSAQDKRVLIQEMQAGFTGDDDEQAILTLLENSGNGDLSIIFGAQGLDVKALNRDFHGQEQKRLTLFYLTRFEGGLDALLLGKVKPIGAAKDAPKFAYSWPVLKTNVEGPHQVDELYELLKSFKPDEQSKAIADLQKERVVKFSQVEKDAEKLQKLQGAAKKTEGTRLEGELAIIRKIDELIQLVYRDIAISEPPATLSTHALTDTEKDAAQKALKPPVRTNAAGVPLPFKEPASYESKLRDHLSNRISDLYNNLVIGRGKAEHSDPNKVHSVTHIEKMANRAKDETDTVFGAYYDSSKRPALKMDRRSASGRVTRRGNIHDLWQEMENQLKAMSNRQRREMARDLIFYFLQADRAVYFINRQHNANPLFRGSRAQNPEAHIQNALVHEFTNTRAKVKRLNEIDQGWPATASTATADINIQIFKEPAVQKDRWLLWDMFQTFIHEYLHTLVHANYRAYATGFTGGHKSIESNTLMEGVDSLLTEIVWANVKPKVQDKGLREIVEGIDYAKLPLEPDKVIPPISQQRYASYAQAIKLLQITGIRNLYAAYFLGQTELIGKR
ncbi:MAG: DUF4157 domain-containing protein [Caldilineaceae bacterium]